MPADQKLGHGSHRGHVRAEVENVSHAKKTYQCKYEWLGEALAHARRESTTGDTTEARTDFLNRAHQWKCEQRGPQHAEAELHSDLGISGDSARIVIGGAGDQTGSKLSQY